MIIPVPAGDFVLVHWRTILQPFPDLQPVVDLETLPLFVMKASVDGRMVVAGSPFVGGLRLSGGVILPLLALLDVIAPSTTMVDPDTGVSAIESVLAVVAALPLFAT